MVISFGETIMSKNIEINYKNDSSTYETLYPKSLATNITMPDSNITIDQAIENHRTDDTFEVGDIICTTRPNMSEKWLLCDGAVATGEELGAILPDYDWEGVYADYGKLNSDSGRALNFSSYKIGENYYLCQSNDSELNIYLLENKEWNLVTQLKGYFYPITSWRLINNGIYVLLMADDDSRYQNFIYSLDGRNFLKGPEINLGDSSMGPYIGICNYGIFYSTYSQKTYLMNYNNGEWVNTIKYDYVSTEYSFGCGEYMASTYLDYYGKIKLLNVNTGKVKTVQTNIERSEGNCILWYDEINNNLYLINKGACINLNTFQVENFTSFSCEYIYNEAKIIYNEEDDMYYYGYTGAGSATYFARKTNDLKIAPESLTINYGNFLFKKDNRYWKYADNKITYIDVPQFQLPNLTSQSTNDTKEKYYIKATL